MRNLFLRCVVAAVLCVPVFAHALAPGAADILPEGEVLLLMVMGVGVLVLRSRYEANL